MEGSYRRRIRVLGEDRSVTAEMEDDFHRFAVDLDHDGLAVIGCRPTAERYPWITCVEAVEPLQALVGLHLHESHLAVGRVADARHQCTHLFDLAGLAVRHAYLGTEWLQYDIAVGGADGGQVGDRHRALLWRDSELVAEWHIARGEVVAPDEKRGVQIRGGSFAKWAASALSAEQAEQAFVLRRAIQISSGRGVDLDSVERASDRPPDRIGSCYSFQPGTAERAVRVRGTIRDFSSSPHRLLSEDVR